jgi:tetratricopeptide (TPR) repeat protein
MFFVRPLLVVFSLTLLVSVFDGSLLAADRTPPERKLKEIVERQKALFEAAEKSRDDFDEDNFRSQLQQLANEYDALIGANQDFAAAYAAYGFMLGKAGMRKESVKMLLRANQLDKELPLVKNQLGNYLAEEGQPLEAANYYLSAIELEPKEPLYHFQLGSLLAEARDDFIEKGEWTRAKLDEAMHREFETAMNLAPDDWRYAYRYGLSFYDLATSEWEAALQFWDGFEKKLKPGIEQQVCRLHQAKVLLQLRRLDEAQTRLESVTEASLAAQRERVVSELAAARKKAEEMAAQTAEPAK